MAGFFTSKKCLVYGFETYKGRISFKVSIMSKEEDEKKYSKDSRVSYSVTPEDAMVLVLGIRGDEGGTVSFNYGAIERKLSVLKKGFAWFVCISNNKGELVDEFEVNQFQLNCLCRVLESVPANSEVLGMIQTLIKSNGSDSSDGGGTPPKRSPYQGRQASAPSPSPAPTPPSSGYTDFAEDDDLPF